MSRFTEFVSEDQINNRVNASIPENTTKKEKWAMKVFDEWHRNRIANLTINDLNVYKSNEEMDKSDLNFLLKRFFFEIRRKDGKKYPPRSLYDLFSMINYHFTKTLKKNWSLFKDSDFNETRQCLSAAMKETASEGITSGNKKAGFISNSTEKKLWDDGVLGKSNPTKLEQSVIYLIGIHFCLRGGNELRRLRFKTNPQITFQKDEEQKECLIYKEDVSKCNAGSLKTIGVKGKTVVAYHNEMDHDRCLPCLFKIFLSRRPANITTDSLFLTAYIGDRSDNEPWYKNCPLGKNSLYSIVKQIMENVEGRFSNQSLRRTGTTRMFQKGFQEDVVRKTTGHRSNAIGEYKELSRSQKMEVSNSLYGVEVNQDINQMQEQSVLGLLQGQFKDCTFNITIHK